MSNGIRSLPRYQGGGGPVGVGDPDDWLERLYRMLQERGIVGSEPPSIPDIRFYVPDTPDIDPPIVGKAAMDDYVLRKLVEDGTLPPEALDPPPPNLQIVDEDFLARKAAMEERRLLDAAFDKQSDDLRNRLLAYMTPEQWKEIEEYADRQNIDWASMEPQLMDIGPEATGGTEAEVVEDLLRQINEDIPRPPRSIELPYTPKGKGTAGILRKIRGGIRSLQPLLLPATGAALGSMLNPVSALADVMMSPTQLGSGELSEESRFSPEEKMKYYDELTNLGRELGVGRHRPSILQLSREINGPSIRSSYPMGR